MRKYILKRNILIIFFVLVIIAGCARKTPQQAEADITVIDKTYEEDRDKLRSKTVRNENTLIQRKNEIIREAVIPYEMMINERVKFLIKDNGIVEIDDNVYVYSEYSNGTVRTNDVLLRYYGENNIFGIYIVEQNFSGGTVGFTIIYNAETQELLMNQSNYKDELQPVHLYDFFSIRNHFIVAFDIKAHAYDDLTGELLWTQVYNQKMGKSFILYNDHFVVDDEDGNKYRIYGDGRKEKFE